MEKKNISSDMKETLNIVNKRKIINMCKKIKVKRAAETEQWTLQVDSGEKDIGNYLKMNRESRGYSQKEICYGICSDATYSRIETGERVVDFIMIEAFFGRIKIEKFEYEFILDDVDYLAYEHRENIDALVKEEVYQKAEEEIEAYEEKYGGNDLHGQFLYFQKGRLERTKEQPDLEKVKDFFVKALAVTMPDYQKVFEEKGILSNLELRCIIEIMFCNRNLAERKKKYEELYTYFEQCYRRDGFYPLPRRIAMQYYAECLYEEENYDTCIQICDEALEELFGSSKVEDKAELFYFRARAREARGFKNEEEEKLCLKDFLTAYHLFFLYGREKKKEALKKYLEEKCKWQFTD